MLPETPSKKNPTHNLIITDVPTLSSQQCYNIMTMRFIRLCGTYNMHRAIFVEVLILLKVNKPNLKLVWKFCDILKRNVNLSTQLRQNQIRIMINVAFVLEDIEISKCSPESGWAVKCFETSRDISNGNGFNCSPKTFAANMLWYFLLCILSYQTQVGRS